MHSCFCKIQCDADVAELADALDSGSSESFFHMGSSPFICTKQNTEMSSVFFCCLKGLCAIAPHFVCELIFYGWRSLLQTSLSVRYYAHFVLYKSLHLHQKMAIPFGCEPFFCFLSHKKGLERVGIVDS